ncbi:MAG: hypothetical protein ACK5IJ_02025 [Mangrovibacterium sp.]
MTGKEIYNSLIEKRDFSGSKSDEYAQLLETLYFSINEELFPMLEKAEKLNKKLSISNSLEKEGISVEVSGYITDDVIFV